MLFAMAKVNKHIKQLQDPVYRQNAAAIADGFRKCAGAKGAADKIESCCKR